MDVIIAEHAIHFQETIKPELAEAAIKQQFTESVVKVSFICYKILFFKNYCQVQLLKHLSEAIECNT